MRREEKEKFLVDIVFAAVLVALIYLILKLTLGVILPFAAGFAMAAITRPTVRRAAAVLKIKSGAAGAAAAVLIYIMLGAAAVGAAWLACSKLAEAAAGFPQFYRETLLPALERLSDWGGEALEHISPELAGEIFRKETELFDAAGQALLKTPLSVVALLSGAAGAMPRVAMTAAVTVLASVFIGADYEKIVSFMLRALPSKVRLLLPNIKKNILGALAKMFKAYMMLTALTFLELLAAFWMMGLKNAAGAALAIALIDLLPILGAGAAMLPWAGALLLTGEYDMAVWVALSWAGITAVRAVLEPKIIGRQAGLHPLAALAAIYVGGVFFGITGALIMPALLAVLKALSDEGLLKLR